MLTLAVLHVSEELDTALQRSFASHTKTGTDIELAEKGK